MLGRLKFEIAPLVKEMLDLLPDRIWTSISTTFLDPAMAGGQFLVAIEQRLRDAGHSDENIASRVYGFEKNKLRVNYAKNNKKLCSQHLYKGDFFNHNWHNMKFDVIVGNPPYQNTHGAKRWPIWHEFVSSASQLSNQYVLMVTPNSWMGAASSPAKTIIWNNLVECSFDVDKYFNVGSTFSWFFLDMKNAQDTFTAKIQTSNFLVNKKTEWLPSNISAEALSINSKVFASKSFAFKRGECHTSNQEKFADKGYEVFHTHVQTLFLKEQPPNYKKCKVAFTLSGNTHPKIGENFGVSQAVAYLIINKKEKTSAEQVFNSQLFQWLLKNNKWSGWNSLDVIKKLPRVDLNEIWDDEKLFSYFQLSKEEIRLIQS